MGIYSRLTSLFRASPPGPRAAGGIGPFTNGGFLGGRFGGGTPNTTGVNVNERSALSLPAFFCGVNCIASDLSALPLELVQKLPDGSTRKAVEHPAYSVFSRSPDGVTTPMRWRSAITAHALIYGGGFAEVVPSVDASRVYLFLMNPDLTYLQFTADGDVQYQTSGGMLPKEKVVHLAGFSHDGVTGHPLVKLARQSLGLGLASEQFGGAYLGNGTGTAGWFKPPTDLKKEARDNFLASVDDRHKGPEQAGRMGILPPGWEFLESKGGANPESAQLLTLRQFSVLDVARLLRVPPHKLADKSGESYASIEASNLDYVQGTLLPWAEAFEQSLNLRLLTDEEVSAGYSYKHNFTDLLRADVVGRTTRNRAMFASASLTPDEWRVSEGFPPLGTPDSTKTYAPMNMTTEPGQPTASGTMEPSK